MRFELSISSSHFYQMCWRFNDERFNNRIIEINKEKFKTHNNLTRFLRATALLLIKQSPFIKLFLKNFL